MGWGVDGDWMPLPTRPQRYCDPASLVLPLLLVVILVVVVVVVVVVFVVVFRSW